MDIERNSRYSRKSNNYNYRLQYESHRSSLRSLDRFSDRGHSLNKKISLINAMDIQRNSSKRNDIDEELLGPNTRFSDYIKNSDRPQSNYSYNIQIQEKDLNRKSNYKILHECDCSQICNQDHCICYLSPNEICIIGLCCPSCIQKKNQFLVQNRYYLSKQERQIEMQKKEKLNQIKQKHKNNMHYFKQVHCQENGLQDIIFCTCKKSHCQKKYCICFQKGIKCGDYCVCQQCENMSKDDEDQSRSEKQRRWERYATYEPAEESEQAIDPNIDQYLDQKMQDEEQFNENMEFEPVDFNSLLFNSLT